MVASIFKSKKSWPYAQNSPQDSVGNLRGPLHRRLLGFQLWEANGDAREVFISGLHKDIFDFLNDNGDRIHESNSYLTLLLFMVGKRPKRTTPTVMFVSNDEAARKEAFNMIKESGIMTNYPDFKLGHASLDELRPLAGDAVLVFSTREGGLEGRRLVFNRTPNSEPSARMATAGGVVSYRDKFMFVTASHPSENSQTTQPAAHTEEVYKGGDCEITGLSDFDDDDDDEDDDVDTVRQGSISEPSDNEGSDLDASPRSPGSTVSERLDESRENSVPVAKSEPHCIKAGKIILRSKELDCALVEVDAAFADSGTLRDIAVPLDSPSGIEPGPRDVAVTTITPDGGTISGTLSGTPCYVRLPCSKTFTEAYEARFTQPLSPGDCGSWVRDAATGRVFGHIFAGSATSGLTMVMPACHVFEYARLSMEDMELCKDDIHVAGTTTRALEPPPLPGGGDGKSESELAVGSLPLTDEGVEWKSKHSVTDLLPGATKETHERPGKRRASLRSMERVSSGKRATTNGLNDLTVWMEDFHAQRGRNMGYYQPSSEMPTYYAPRIMTESSPVTMPSGGTQYSSMSSAGTQCSLMFDEVYTNSSMSTSPPDDAPPHHYQHQPVLGPGPSRLLCEFVEYGHCGATFNVNDEEGWISHIIQSHLGNNFPAHCVCWFCDGEYIAQSNSAADRWASYQARMYHIAHHFRTQALRADQMRPDHFFLDHIHRHGLIGDEEYRHAASCHELEQIPGLHEAGRRPTSHGPGNRVVETNRRRRTHRHRSSRHS